VLSTLTQPLGRFCFLKGSGRFINLKENTVSNNLVYIVQVDEARYVGVDPQGMIHVGWNRVTVHLEGHELRTLAQTLQDSFMEEMEWMLEAERSLAEELDLDLEEYASLSEWEDEYDHLDEFDEMDDDEMGDSVQVWLGDVALLLTLDDFEVFMEMILEAFGLLTHQSRPPKAEQNANFFFSLN
jgi:hypothetical protein